MVSTGWGEPSSFASGFNPEHVAAGKWQAIVIYYNITSSC
jgi:56kDa selenium binding protein (SBP56)